MMLSASFCFGNLCDSGTGRLPRAAGALRADSSRANRFGFASFSYENRAVLMACRPVLLCC